MEYVVIDNKVKSAPRIDGKIGANGMISGHFTMDDANDLSIVLRSGSLPAPVHPIEERTVGPSLGQDSIHKGFFSMIIGTLVVIMSITAFQV